MNPDGDENQNISNGASNADPTQQAIFTPMPTSAPEPQRSAQDSSVIVGSVVEPATTGLSHQYYSNHPTKTSASGVGDIILGSGAKKIKSKNNKKLFVVGGIILGVLLLIFIVTTLIFTNTQKPAAIAEDRFYQFANYILYGQEKTNRLNGEYDNNSSYELDKQFIDKNADFLNKAITLLSESVDEYAKVRDADVLLLRMQDVYSDLEFLLTFLEIEEPDEEKVSEIFLQSGNEATQAFLIRFYEPLWTMKSTEAQQYALQRYEQYLAMSEMLQLYLDHGCINNGVVDMICPLGNDAEKASELTDTMNLNERTTTAIIPGLLRTIESSCWRISYDFQNITKLEGEDYEK